MILDNKLFDKILLRAQESPRRRMNFDLRTQAQIPGQAGNDGEEWLYKWLQTTFL